MRYRLAKVVGRSGSQDGAPKLERLTYAQKRLKETMKKDVGRNGQATVHKLDGRYDPDFAKLASARRVSRP